MEFTVFQLKHPAANIRAAVESRETFWSVAGVMRAKSFDAMLIESVAFIRCIAVEGPNYFKVGIERDGRMYEWVIDLFFYKSE